MTRAQIRNLEERSALWVAKHLVMAGRLLDLDPELAFQHALAASRRGGRLAAVREAVGLTAYGAGHYGEALREFRTFRRISGSNVHLPVMADCERGLGRPDRALDLARSEEAESLDAAGKAELAMVVSGARSDLGQLDAAVAALEIPQLDLHRAFSFSPRLFRAYAAALDAVGRTGESEKWRRQARVAEKALGLDDELEPDIIDLGDDDEPAPSPVPKVSDVLGTPAAAPASADVDEPDSDTVAAEDRTDSEQLAASASNDEVAVAPEDDDEDEGGQEGPSDPSASPAHVEEPADASPEVGVQTVVALTDDGLEVPIVEDEPVVGDASIVEDASAEDAGATKSERAGTGPVPADAIRAGESAASVQPLQAEMLFSMDDAGAGASAPSAVGDAESAGGADDVESPEDTDTPKKAKSVKKAKKAKESKAAKGGKDAKSAKVADGTEESKAAKSSKGVKESKAAKGSEGTK
ncbi:hypothetical protein [Arthrobacter pityocampae]|uniref:hypothetical protein n=1 Tax=Arthrobacter pityocampae TaxID=547334 RepID=UPI003734EF39